LTAGLCIVFVLPHLTDIGQLCLLVAVVSAGAAWVATSSERLAYAGMQIAFAFLLGILQGYVPASDLTVLRDRLVGILLGNIAITLVFSSLWPASAASGLRAALADALRAIADVLKLANHDASRIRTAQALVRADHFRALAAFELRMLPTQAAAIRALPTVSDIDGLAAAAFVATSDSIAPCIDHESTAAYARWAVAAADSLSRNAVRPPLVTAAIPPPAAESPDPRAAIAQHAVARLDSEVRHLAAAIP
jgi:multidrug resistance protein MdtO